MGNNFFTYLQYLELLAFFSGYPLVYAIVIFIAGNQQSKTNFISRIDKLLPFSYALVGTLYLGLQLRNLYPDYSFENIKLSFHEPYLKIWGLLSILYWLPIFSKKPVYSLLHSLFFFFLLAKDLFLHLIQSSTGKTDLRNEMKIYSDSLILNLGAFIVIALIYFLIIRIKANKNSSRSF